MNKNYDYSKFSKSDIRQYKDKLETLPFNPKIQSFFEWRKRELRKLRRADERHLSYESFTKRISAYHDASFEEKIVNDIVLHEALDTLTHIQRRRLKAYHAGYTLQEIAEREGVTIMPIFRSIRKAKAKIKKYLEQGG